MPAHDLSAQPANVTSPILSVQNLTVAFPTDAGPAYAVNQLSFDLYQGQVLGLVGESGCGKSMTSLAILGLIPPPGHITSGQILFHTENNTPQDLRRLPAKAIQKIRGAKIALIPQDPLTSLNPVYTVGDQIMEVLLQHTPMTPAQARVRTIDLLDRVRIPNAKERLKDYPHQFSGGMRQRVMIAMALSCDPVLLIADEPTTALDVTVQAQILALLKELQKDQQTAILLITHDLGVVAETCNDVAVMYAGRLVEKAPVNPLFTAPKHPYTQGLMRSIPTPQKILSKDRLEPIEGQPPVLTEIPKGCAFEPRCANRMPQCTLSFPGASQVGVAHQVFCYLVNDSD